MFNFLLEGASNGADLGSQWWVYLVLIGLVLVMLIVPSISNRKRAKEYNNMINNIGVGDTVRTVGGIIGRIVKVNEKDGFKTIILETGAKSSKTTMEFDIASIYTVLNSKNQPAAPAAAPVAENKEEQKAEASEVKEEVPAEPENKEDIVLAKKSAKKSNKK